MKDNLTYVKELVATNTVDAIDVLNCILKKDVEIFNEFLLLKKRYFENLNLFHNGLIDYENFNLTFNKCTVGILALIDRIHETDLLPSGIMSKIYLSSKDERNSRVNVNRIVSIDDTIENIKNRTLWKVIFFPFLGIFLVLIGFALIIIDKTSKGLGNLLSEKPFYIFNFIFVILMCIFGIAQVWKTFYYRRVNKGNLPRVRQQLQIKVKGNYDLIFDSLYRTLCNLKMKITDYQYQNGKIQAEYRNMFLIERLFSTYSGERITIEISKDEKDDLNCIEIMSTSKSYLSAAHEGDFLGMHKSINRKNLQKIQKYLILNLTEI